MAIRWDKFTVKSQEAVQNASQLAAENGNPEILPLHLLAVLLADKEGVIPAVLEKIGVPTDSSSHALWMPWVSCRKSAAPPRSPGRRTR